MDRLSGILFFSGAASNPTITQHSAVIDAIDGAATGSGTYEGSTGTVSQDAYRFGGFSGSCYFELVVGSGGWPNSCGFAGILDSAHWNANPNYGGSTGERMMLYIGTQISYGSNTGTTLVSNTGYTSTFASGDTAGFVYNESNGKMCVYKNGTAGPIFQNSGFIGITKYPCVSYWTANMIGTMRTTPSAYAGSYVLP